MDQTSKRRGRPVPDAVNMKHIAFKLEDALAVENLYRPNILLFQNDRKPWEVTLVARDGAVRNILFLRFWFDLPHTIYFAATTYLDLFLSRMKVQEKYLKCLTVSCFYLAATKEGFKIDVEQLITLSQSKCSVKDMHRMADIVKQKLKLDNTSERVITSADFIMIYIDILEYLKQQWNAEYLLTELLQKENLLTRLAVAVLDCSCSFFRPCTLALVIIQLEVDKFMAQGLPEKSVYYLGEMIHLVTVIRELQHTCQIKSTELVNCYANVSNVLKRYDGQNKTQHCESLMWRFSASTIALSNRNRQFQLRFDTIEEKNQTD